MSKVLQRLQAWFKKQCNGEWEHSFGISIETLDNPGWQVKIDLEGTPFATRPFEELIRGQVGSDDVGGWIQCKCVENVFEGTGDITKLEEILDIFLDWVEEPTILASEAPLE